jgi:hypothetical protein
MAVPEPTPAPVVPPAPAPVPDPQTAAPPAAPPAGTRSAAEIENELLKAQLASRDKDKDLHSLKEKNRVAEEKLAASRQALKAAGVIDGDEDPKAIVEKQQKDARAKERAGVAIERAAMRKLLGSGLGEEDADLILAKVVRDSRVSFDDATGAVSGIDDVFTALKPTIERLAGKPTHPAPLTAPPVPPNPASGALPLDGEFAAIKTWDDLMAKPISFQERFEVKHPNEFRALETMFYSGAQRGRPITLARPPQPVAR